MNKLIILLVLLFKFIPVHTQELSKYILYTTYNSTTTPFDKKKVLNVARGGQGISGDLNWMPKFYNKLNEIGIDEFRVDWLLSNRFYNVVTRNSSGTLVYNFTNLDKNLVPMLQKGIKPMMCMTYMATPLGKDSFPPNNYDEYAAVISTYVKYYKDMGYTGLAWESHNEPEGFTKLTPQQTYQMYRVFAGAVKSVDPTARVGGFGAVGLDWIGYIRSFLDYYKADIAKPAMDFFSFHQYGNDSWHYVPTIESAFTTRGLAIPDLYITEWNNHWGTAPGQGNFGKSGPGNTFDTNLNACYLAKKMFLSYQYPNVKKIYYFNFADTDKSRLYTGDMGLFTWDSFHRKSAANTFWFYSRMHNQQLNSIVSGATSDRNTFGFITIDKDSSQLAIILWNYQNKPVEFKTLCGSLPVLPANMEYTVDKYLIDSIHGNHYHDFRNGWIYLSRSPNEYAKIVNTYKMPTNSVNITDTLSKYSVVQYIVRPTIKTTGIRSTEDVVSDMKIFPNHVSSTMNISFNLNKSFPVQIAVTDVSGRQHLVVDKGLMNENQTHNFQIDISALQSGIYSVILLAGNRKVKTNRILKL
jgi:hypothetical protein